MAIAISNSELGTQRLAGAVRILAARLLPALLLASLGCGGSGPLGQVSGQVTYQGKPVTEGKIVFLPEKGPAAFGALDGEGCYRLTTASPGDGAVVGGHTVSIVPVTRGVQLEPGKAPAPPKPALNLLPLHYQDPKTSGLIANVKPGSNKIDFAIPGP